MADNETKPGSDRPLYIGTGLLFTFMLFSRFEKWLRASANHQILFAGILGIMIAAICYWASITREIVKNQKEREAKILGPEENAVFCGTTIGKRILDFFP